MNRNNTRQWLIALMVAVISITTAYADERDMGTWSENTGFGQNGANLTADGYSLWDGWSFQNYELKLNGKGLVTVTFQSLSGSKSRFFLDEVLVMPLEISAIETMSTSSIGRIYTLDGRFMGTNKETLEHGIYIIDGKKIIK